MVLRGKVLFNLFSPPHSSALTNSKGVTGDPGPPQVYYDQNETCHGATTSFSSTVTKAKDSGKGPFICPKRMKI